MRKVIIIGVRPGELAGDEARIYHAPVYVPPVKATRSGIFELQENKDAVPLLEDGKPVTVPRCGARPPGHHGKDDPGDPGIPTYRFRVAYWIPVAPGLERPLPRAWLSAVCGGKEDATLDELAALRAGKFVEVVIDETTDNYVPTAGVPSLGQRHATESQDSLRAALIGVWDALLLKQAGLAAAAGHPLIGFGV